MWLRQSERASERVLNRGAAIAQATHGTGVDVWYDLHLERILRLASFIVAVVLAGALTHTLVELPFVGLNWVETDWQQNVSTSAREVQRGWARNPHRGQMLGSGNANAVVEWI